ncbi:MAG: WD40 repeat domain-containing protein, partial [Armatimonadetes bacterium]|nr:WD40 repeat domain-containing protein [Armatimonadota bacterium]
MNDGDLVGLVADYDLLPDEAALQEVRAALELSAHVLFRDPLQLAGQLAGRLLSSEHAEVRAMAGQAAPCGQARAVPSTASLRPPGTALLRTLEGHTGRVMSVALTADGKRAVSGSDDNTLRVWDLETGKTLRTLEGHTGWVMSVALTADGKRAVSGSDDKTLRVWDMETGKSLRTLEGHTGPVMSVALTADGKRAVSGSGDKTLRVWDLETGKSLRTLEGHTGPVMSVALTADGKRAVSGSDDNRL